MTLGETIIAAIVRGELVRTVEPGHQQRSVLVWSSGAAEQLEAVVAEHVEACMQELRDELNRSQNQFAACDANLTQAIVDLECLRMSCAAKKDSVKAKGIAP